MMFPEATGASDLPALPISPPPASTGSTTQVPIGQSKAAMDFASWRSICGQEVRF
jgi:hypothetical protein